MLEVLNSPELREPIRVSKTVSESDVYLFAGITGDLHPNHTNEVYMANGRYGKRLAHGALIVGLMSAASTALLLRHHLDGVSLGYDRVRFLAPVFFGDTVDVVYTVENVDEEKSRSVADIRVSKDDGELVAVAQHLMKYIR